MGVTTIEWTDSTWNPTRGCSRVSPGCINCYAEQLAGRYSAYGAKPDSPFVQFVTKVNGHASWTGKVELIESKLTEPLSWRKPCRVFVNSMSDLFHEALPDEAIDRVFAVMALCPQHTFQVLTKRPERMLAYFVDFRERMHRIFTTATGIGKLSGRIAFETLEQNSPLPNVWLGVSVEDRARKDRIALLRQTPAALRFLSLEPLLEDIGDLDLTGIDWVIVGGESGPGARRFDLEWMQSCVEQCKAAGTAIFCKQIGSNPYWAGYPLGRGAVVDRKGGDIETWPEWARVREFPTSTSVREVPR